MAETGRVETRCDLTPAIAAELAAAGVDDAHEVGVGGFGVVYRCLGATLFCALTGHAAVERRSGEQVVAQFLRVTSQTAPTLRGEHIPDDSRGHRTRDVGRSRGSACDRRRTRGRVEKPSAATVSRWMT
jgi:hypothetical protein